MIPKAYEDCLKDNIGREHPVPEDVIKRQMHRFEIPFIEEGFDKIKIWDLGNYKSIVPKYRYRDMVFMMYRFDQKNPHHKRNLLSHSTHTHNLFLKKTLGEFDSSCYFGSRLHDIGKLFTQVFDENGIAHYNQHPNVGSYFVLTRIMLPLAWDSHWNETEDEWFLNCCFLINYHMIPFHIQTDEQKEKYQRMFGEYKYKMLNDFHKCDISD